MIVVLLIKELIARIQGDCGCFITVGNYEIQIYSDGKSGNIKRKDDTVVCAFNLDDERIIIVPAKLDIPYQFGYRKFTIKSCEEVNKLETINHRDSAEICKVFMNYTEN